MKCTAGADGAGRPERERRHLQRRAAPTQPISRSK